MRRGSLHKVRQRLPITAQVLLLAILAVCMAQVISYAVILLTPASPVPRMTLAAARSALQSQAGAEAANLDRTVSNIAPFRSVSGSNALNAAAIAYGLGTDPSRIRLRQAGVSIEPAADDRSLVITHPPGRKPSARLERLPSSPSTVSGEMAALLLASDFRLPPFEAAWHRPDGRWVAIEPRTPLVADWRIRLAISLILGLGFVVPIAWLASRSLTRPVLALAAAASASRLGARPLFGDDGPPEVREASAALMAMHQRLEAQFAERLRMLVAIAHDLRTPLTALRLRIEANEPAERARQSRLADRMERMIREILDYATTSRGEAAEFIDVTALVRSLLPDADATGVPIRFCGMHSIKACLPPIKASRIVTNLIDNAIRYASNVEVSVSRNSDDLTIIVADRGPGIAEDDLARMLEPFVRGDTSRSRRTGGTGLGLTISRDLAVELGGALVLKVRPGGGLIAELTLDPGRT